MRRPANRIVEATRRFVYLGSEDAPHDRARLMRRARGFGLAGQGIALVGGLISANLHTFLMSLGVVVVIGLCLHLVRLERGRFAALAVNLAIGTLIWANVMSALHLGGGANPNIVTFPTLCVFATSYIAGIRTAAAWAAVSIAGMGLVLSSSPLPAPEPGIYSASRAVLFGHHGLVLVSAFALAGLARRFEDWQSAQLEFLARHDPLTGLLNRRELESRIEESQARAGRHGWRTALLFVDLDRFKRINDEEGHHAGDVVLREVAERIRSITRATDAVARLGGDEFVVLLESTAQEKDAETYASRLLSLVSQPISLDGRDVRVTASIGVASQDADGSDVETLIRAADTAMYEAKRSGGDRLSILRL